MAAERFQEREPGKDIREEFRRSNAVAELCWNCLIAPK